MAELFVMPQASPTMVTGVIAKWVAPEGSDLAPQSVIAQVETDKATMDIEVFDKGVMLKHLVAEGAEVPAGAPIAIIGKAKGEDISALLAEYEKSKGAAPASEAAPTKASEAAPAKASEAAPAAQKVVAAPEAAPAAPAPAAPAPAVPAPTAAMAGPASPQAQVKPGEVPKLAWMGRAIPDAIMEPLSAYVPPGVVVRASPLAKAMAADKGLALAKITGTGTGGRIVAADVEAAATAPQAAPAPSAAAGRREDVTVRATQMRKTIARRLTDAHQSVPVFYLTVTFDGAGLVALKEQAGKRGIKVSYNDLVLKAVAQALVDVPECNAAWQGDTIVRRGSVDLGVAVALPEGLITPVIRDADKKSVRQIGAELRELAARAKTGKLAPEEYTGASFSVSNLGMLEIDQFTAILNPPEAGILAVGALLQVPVVENGALTVGWRMKATLTCDHRVIDGALGARLLQALRGYVELPALMVI
ncbi:MAG: dihydrolipoamide acetyltransferase family protein [Pseudomonadota bacterium]|nr:dihydrolipoamide acetyltransferase family protein [Pseudomonadota bacterium]